MDNKTLCKVQDTMLGMARDICNVCDRYDIHYFLDGGTMLGAVRHEGFIPWDDDFDIGMLRSDYDRFISIAQDELGDRYFVQTNSTDKEYGFWFAKIRLVHSLYEETAASNNSKFKGFFVDIFPYDNFPNSEKDKIRVCKRLEIIKKAMLAKTGYPIWKRNEGFSTSRFVLYKLARIFLIPFNKRYICRLYDKIATQWNLEDTLEVFPQGNSKSGRFHMERSLFTDRKKVKFENVSFYILTNYDTFLKQLYGDYMQLPPENERGNRHNIKRILFEEDLQ